MRSTTTMFLIWGKDTSIDQACSPGEKTVDRVFFFTVKTLKEFLILIIFYAHIRVQLSNT